MHNQVLINVEATDLRVAVLENGELVELFVEKFDKRSMLGCIYKGRIEAIVPGLKAAFVNIGMEKNAFLHFADVLPEYRLPERGRPERLHSYKVTRISDEEKAWGDAKDDEYDPPPGENEEGEKVEEPKPPPKAAKGSKTLKVGDTILVQVTKEPLGLKGPRVTTYLSLPGRYLVMMPFAESTGGVSRKIMDGEERRRLKDLLRSLKDQQGQGSFIIRTVGLTEGEAAIREDFDALKRRWEDILARSKAVPGPAIVHDESSILQRLVRDTIRADVDEILIDSLAYVKDMVKTCEAMAPATVDRVHFFESPKNIFEVFEVEKQFQKAIRRKVWLKSGGAIVIDETEALAAIDVNSGKYVGEDDQDSVILKTNLEACHAISRQLRLRDMGGLIVIDFIDMTNRDHQRQVLAELRSCLRRDNAKYSMTGFSEFGLVEMTRKRVRMSLANAIYKACPYCEGSGKILGEAEIWKLVKYAIVEELEKTKAEALEVRLHSEIRAYLQREVLPDIKALAAKRKVKLNFVGRPDFHWEQFEIVKPEESTISTESAGVPERRPSPEKRVESPRMARG